MSVVKPYTFTDPVACEGNIEGNSITSVGDIDVGGEVNVGNGKVVLSNDGDVNVNNNKFQIDGTTGEATSEATVNADKFNSTGVSSDKISTGTTDQRPATLERGLIRYNTTTENFEGYNGTEWRQIGTGEVVPEVGSEPNGRILVVSGGQLVYSENAAGGSIGNVFLNDELSDTINGNLTGSEGKRKCVLVSTLIPNSITHVSGTAGSYTILFNASVSADTFYGSFDKINIEYDYYVRGDSGTYYQGFFAASRSSDDAVRTIQIHPKHGDVTSDFTVGNTYPLYIFQESTAPADIQTPNVDIKEFCIGNGDIDIFPTTSGAEPSFPYSSSVWYSGTVTNRTITGTTLGQAAIAKGQVNGNIVLSGTNNQIPIDTTVTWFNDSGSLVYSSTNVTIPNGVFNVTISDIPTNPETLSVRISLSSVGVTLDVTFDTFDTVQSYTLPFAENDLSSLNAGYFNSNGAWVSNILPNAPTNSGMSQIKLKKNATALPTVRFRNQAGTFISHTSTTFALAQTTASSFAYDSNLNTVFINLNNTFSVLGYTSVQDMLANGAVEISYQKKSRRVSPIANPTDVKLLSSVWILGSPNTSLGADLVSELIDEIPTGTTGIPIHQRELTSGYISPADGSLSTEQNLWPTHNQIDSNLVSTSSAVKVLFGIYIESGFYKIALWFRELTHNGSDWGDSASYIPITNNVVTTTDDNNNTIMIGTMSFDTNVAV